jgi:hypothetical protein
MESEKPVLSFVSKEIPVTPPSINPFGMRNPSKPKPAEPIPRIMNNRFLNPLIVFLLFWRLSLALRYLDTGMSRGFAIAFFTASFITWKYCGVNAIVPKIEKREKLSLKNENLLGCFFS